ncbi:MAG: hypothetical protein RL653_4228 [Pseudomonadota bacterium]|jgi:hypothetical protein
MKRPALGLLFILAACPAAGPGPSDAGADDAGTSLRVSSVTPDRGPAAGGTQVAVTGSGFPEGVRLFLGDTEAVDVVRVSSNRLSASTPPAAVGGAAVDVRVLSPAGAEARLPAGFTYEGAPGLSEAVLVTELPADFTSTADAVTVALEAEALAPGRTEASGPAAGLRAQVGFGTPGTAPALTWSDALWIADSGPRDRFGGSVAVPVLGGEPRAYEFAARISVDDGATWTLAAPVRTATVGRPPVAWCKSGGVTTGPDSHALVPGGPAPDVFAQVYHPSLTEADGPASGLEVELGTGAGDADAGAFSWGPAAFNAQQGNNDEWRAALVPPPDAGSYRYAFRARVLGGPWRACDGDGSDNGFDVAQAGTFTVAPLACATLPLAAASVPGGTEVTARATATGAGLRLQAGLGSGPVDGAAWGWSDAAEAPAGEWSLAFTPAYTGSRSVAFRASTDDGGTWWACPPAQPLDVLATASAGYCNLQFPAAVTAGTAAGTVVYGQLYEAGLTEAPGEPAGVTAELGYGKASEDPGLAWTWVPAAYNVQAGNNDEYAAALPAGAAVAGTSYAFRFHLPGGTCHGDLDGNGRAFSFSGEAAGGPNLGAVLP